MKKEYFLRLRCATCGREDSFEYNDDKSYVKCTFCNREYFGGIEELKELNEDVIEEVKEEIENAVQIAFTAYQTAVKELDIQKKSVELANQNYAVVSYRYHNGLALLTDMLDASNAKLSADLNAADAEINIIFHKIKLNYICHTL